MPLTDLQVRKAKTTDKPQKFSDGGGLYLLVQPSGAKYWRLKYRFGGVEKVLALGVYPDVTLLDAREKRDAARKLLANRADPGAVKKAQKAATIALTESSFEIVAREWFVKHAPGWADTHSSKVIRRLEVDVFPWIGGRPIGEITAPELLVVLRRVEERGAIDTAHRVHQNCGQVFRYAIATGRAQRDPAADLRGALPPPSRKHYPTLTGRRL